MDDTNHTISADTGKTSEYIASPLPLHVITKQFFNGSLSLADF